MITVAFGEEPVTLSDTNSGVTLHVIGPGVRERLTADPVLTAMVVDPAQLRQPVAPATDEVRVSMSASGQTCPLGAATLPDVDTLPSVCDHCGSKRLIPLSFVPPPTVVGAAADYFDAIRPVFKCLNCGHRQNAPGSEPPMGKGKGSSPLRYCGRWVCG